MLIAAESFLPQTNGVVTSVLRVLEHLQRRRDEVLVITHDAGHGVPREVSGAAVRTIPSFAFPKHGGVRVATPGGPEPIARVIAQFAPDVVHLASPFVLGWRTVLAARAAHVPTVAVYQTDVPGYAAHYGAPWGERLLWRRVVDIHSRATRTLVPSTASLAALTAHGVPRMHLWRRGVDTALFSPHRASAALRAQVAPNGERIIGYVGRLAPEKRIGDLAALSELPGTRILIVGDGPERAALEAAMPTAVFLGMLHGDALAAAVATFDVAVLPSETETFGQVLQEAMASGVPVIAPASGGPIDLVEQSRTGWLYRPGDLAGLRAAVLDLLGDESKRLAFAAAARTAMLPRSWSAVCGELVGHYAAAIEATAQVPAPTTTVLRRWPGPIPEPEHTQ